MDNCFGRQQSDAGKGEDWTLVTEGKGISLRVKAEEIFKGIMEIIPPELMNDEKPQIDKNHREQRGVIRKITLLDISYVKIQDYQR